MVYINSNMIAVNAVEHVGFPPNDVFDAGIRAINWPEIKGLTLEADEESLALGSLLRVTLNVPALSIGLDCRVTEFEPGSNVLIEGKAPVGKGKLRFLLDETTEGTQVDYRLALSTNRLLEMAAKPVMKGVVRDFADSYKIKISDYLSAR